MESTMNKTRFKSVGEILEYQFEKGITDPRVVINFQKLRVRDLTKEVNLYKDAIIKIKESPENTNRIIVELEQELLMLADLITRNENPNETRLFIEKIHSTKTID